MQGYSGKKVNKSFLPAINIESVTEEDYDEEGRLELEAIAA